MAMAKLKASEVLAFIADEAIQIHGGMGVMDELPLERILWDALSMNLGRHQKFKFINISRKLLRPLGSRNSTKQDE